MAKPKGAPKTGGRQKGVPNKTTALARVAIEDAFDHLQGLKKDRKDFKSWAEDNAGDFYKLLFPKLLPVQINHADNEGGKLVVTWQTGE